MKVYRSRGMDVLEFQFPHSSHCQHHETNPDLYTEFLNRILTAMGTVMVASGEDNHDEGWSDDEEFAGHELVKSRGEQNNGYHVVESTTSRPAKADRRSLMVTIDD